MNKLFRYTAAAVLVASFGMLGNYTADAAKFLESPREVHIVKPELPEDSSNSYGGARYARTFLD